MADFSTIPSGATLKVTPYNVHADQQKLEDMKQLIKLSPLGPKTYENQQESSDRRFGVSMKWMQQAKEDWTSSFDWRKHEEYINSFPNFTVPIADSDGKEHKIHFVGLFSSSSEPTTPLLFMHGWPGSILEFLPVLEVLRKRYTPSTLPYNVIVPSLPGYAFSEGPSLDRQWSMQDGAHMMDKLMVGLGLKGYVAQGGDIGSYFCRVLAKESDSCKAMHLNFCKMSKPKAEPKEAPSEAEKKGLERAKDFDMFGSAYAREHGTRPATIGVVLSSSPVALLAWIGEKFLSWTDTDPSTDTILAHVTLYWLTSTFPRAIYPYAAQGGRPHPISPTDNPATGNIHENSNYYITKPFGYSWFPQELAPVPVSWAATTGNLVWHRSHESGGHFAAMEKPDLLVGDVEDFVKGLKGQGASPRDQEQYAGSRSASHL